MNTTDEPTAADARDRAPASGPASEPADTGGRPDQRLSTSLAGPVPTDAAARRLADATALIQSDGTTTKRGWWQRLRQPNPARQQAVEADARALIERIGRPFSGSRTIAVASTKGGVGKTTITTLLGHTLASLRDDRVVALDANPDAGSLIHRVERESTANAVDLLDLVGSIRDYYDLRHFTSQSGSRLEVIASPDDPRDTRGISESDTHELLRKLRTNYTLILTDCGTGVMTGTNRAITAAADQLVLVTAPRVDATHSLTYMLRWLAGAGHADKASDAIVVVNGTREDQGVDLGKLTDHFRGLAGQVVTVPWDAGLSHGGQADLEYLGSPTRHAIAQLAAVVSDGLSQRVGKGHG